MSELMICCGGSSLVLKPVKFFLVFYIVATSYSYR